MDNQKYIYRLLLLACMDKKHYFHPLKWHYNSWSLSIIWKRNNEIKKLQQNSNFSSLLKLNN